MSGSSNIGEGSQTGVLGALSVAHLVNDWYMNFPQVLLPFFAAAGLPVSRGAFLVTGFAITSSLLQPLFGWWSDRRDLHFPVYVGTLWMALCMGALAWTQGYAARLALVGLAGLGTAAFHPQASALVARGGGRSKGLWLGVFVAAGNVGWAFSPLLLGPLLRRSGPQALAWCSLPGLCVAALLAAVLRRPATPPPSPAAPASPTPAVPPRARSTVAKILPVVALRSWAYFGFISFLPLLQRERGMDPDASSLSLFCMLFSGALGGLAGGFLSDRLAGRDGRRRILASTLLASSPLLLAQVALPQGPLSVLLLALGGAALLASFSITVVMAQKALGRSAALASGLTLGFGVGMGGLGVGLSGALAERWGVEWTLSALSLLPAAAAAIALSLPSDRSM